eukprot:493754-Rhodomonas_salina.3
MISQCSSITYGNTEYKGQHWQDHRERYQLEQYCHLAVRQSENKRVVVRLFILETSVTRSEDSSRTKKPRASYDPLSLD